MVWSESIYAARMPLIWSGSITRICLFDFVAFLLVGYELLRVFRRLWLVLVCQHLSNFSVYTQEAKFMGPTWGPPGSCRPQMGPILTPWTLLSGHAHNATAFCSVNKVADVWVTLQYIALICVCSSLSCYALDLTHLPLVPHICVRESVNNGSDNGLSPIRCQAII